MGSPYAHMSTPTGVLIPDPYGVRLRDVTLLYRTPTGSGTNPLRGLVSGSFFFSYRTVSLRLPGSYTTPRRGVVMSTP